MGKRVVYVSGWGDADMSRALARKDAIHGWGEKLTILGSAIIGIGAILFAIAAFWHPKPNGGTRMYVPDDVPAEEATGE